MRNNTCAMIPVFCSTEQKVLHDFSNMQKIAETFPIPLQALLI